MSRKVKQLMARTLLAKAALKNEVALRSTCQATVDRHVAEAAVLSTRAAQIFSSSKQNERSV